MAGLMQETLQVVADEDDSTILIFHRNQLVGAYSEEENSGNIAAVLHGLCILLTNLMMAAPKVEFYFFAGNEPLSRIFETEDYLHFIGFDDLENMGRLEETEDFLVDG